MISLLGLLSYLYMGAEFLSKDKQQQQQQKLFIFIIRSIHRLTRIHKGSRNWISGSSTKLQVCNLGFLCLTAHRTQFFSVNVTNVRCSGVVLAEKQKNRSLFCNIIGLCIIELRYEDPRKCSHCYRRSTRNREADLQSSLVKRW